jgi:hypothetical protein
VTTFDFRFDPRYARLLSLVGVRPGRAEVMVDGSTFDARFGPWHCTCPLDNIDGVETTGPYQPWKVIGPHLSLADRGLTFGTNTERGLCIRFPVPGPRPRTDRARAPSRPHRDGRRHRRPGPRTPGEHVAVVHASALLESWNVF